MDSVIQSIQTDVADRLLADPYFGDAPSIPVLTENIGDIENQIDIAIAQIGAFVLVVTPTVSIGNMKNAPGPYFERIRVTARCYENVTVNRGGGGTLKNCLPIAEHVAALIHGYRPDILTESIYGDDPTIQLVPEPNGLLTYDVNFLTHGGLRYDVTAVATPTFTQNGSLLTIASTTPYAQIFYAVDNAGYPSPRSGTFYAAPITVLPGQVVKARGWLAGYQTSAQAAYTVT